MTGWMGRLPALVFAPILALQLAGRDGSSWNDHGEARFGRHLRQRAIEGSPMSAKIWFSTKIRVVGLLESGGATGYRDSVFLIQAADFDDAFRRALEVGRAEERTYVNANGVNLRWALTEVISVDWLGEQLEDGKEVYSEPLELEVDPELRFDTRFAPEQSTPTQTV